MTVLFVDRSNGIAAMLVASSNHRMRLLNFGFWGIVRWVSVFRNVCPRFWVSVGRGDGGGAYRLTFGGCLTRSGAGMVDARV